LTSVVATRFATAQEKPNMLGAKTGPARTVRIEATVEAPVSEAAFQLQRLAKISNLKYHFRKTRSSNSSQLESVTFANSR
jgi:hypothetical protein